MAEELDFTLDTSSMTKIKHVSLDGIVYEMRPLKTREFYAMQKNAKTLQALEDDPSEENLHKSYEIMREVVTPLMSPNDKFVKWVDGLADISEIAASMALSQLLSVAVKMTNE